MVTIYELGNVDGSTRCFQIGRLFLPGSMTSVTVPAGILQSGTAYAFLIAAHLDPGYDLAAAPWGNHRFPYGMSQTLTNWVTP